MGHKLAHVLLDVNTKMVEVVLQSELTSRNTALNRDSVKLCSFLTNVNTIEIKHMEIIGIKGNFNSILEHNKRFGLVFKNCKISRNHRLHNFRDYEAKGYTIFKNCEDID